MQNKTLNELQKLQNREDFLEQLQIGADVPARSSRKIGRNEPCPCGAKKEDGVTPVKYKKCCLNRVKESAKAFNF